MLAARKGFDGVGVFAEAPRGFPPLPVLGPQVPQGLVERAILVPGLEHGQEAAVAHERVNDQHAADDEHEVAGDPAAATPRQRRGRVGAIRGLFHRELSWENIAFQSSVQANFVSDAVLVLTTIGSDADAVEFARILVEEHLAACVNVLPPMTSVYRWKGGVEQESEHQVVIKTTRGRLDALASRLRKLHPYDVPEFLVIPVSDGSEAYLAWLGESVR